jgi:hypothetical protein
MERSVSELLERQLYELASRLDVDVDQRMVNEVLARLDAVANRRVVAVPRRRLLIVSAVLVSAAAILLLLVPGPRSTIAHWFGFGSTRIDPVPTTPSTSITTPPTGSTGSTASTNSEPQVTTTVTFPARLQLGSPLSAEEATTRTGLPVPFIPSFGAPTGIFVTSPPDSGQIVVVYPPSANLASSPVAGIGALLSTMPGTINEGLFVKTQRQGTTLESLSFVNASGVTVAAVWIGGAPHDYVFEDRNGTPVFDTLRLATTTLLWQDGDVTYRLEATLTREQAVAIAATVTSG